MNVVRVVAGRAFSRSCWRIWQGARQPHGSGRGGRTGRHRRGNAYRRSQLPRGALVTRVLPGVPGWQASGHGQGGGHRELRRVQQPHDGCARGCRVGRGAEGCRIEVVGNGFSTKGRAVVDMRLKTLTYVLSKDGRSPSKPARRPEPARYWEVEADKLTLTTKDATGKPLPSACGSG